MKISGYLNNLCEQVTARKDEKTYLKPNIQKQGRKRPQFCSPFKTDDTTRRGLSAHHFMAIRREDLIFWCTGREAKLGISRGFFIEFLIRLRGQGAEIKSLERRREEREVSQM